ncbi:MAG: histidine kinase dimerization/phospho-acceptor domain-containing protein [Oscillospiraceae bacterium]
MSLKISQNEKMQTEFISSVSHELRTPLTAINGWGETILEDPTGDSQLAAGHPDYSERVPAPVHHGGGTAGVLQNAGRPLYTPD